MEYYYEDDKAKMIIYIPLSKQNARRGIMCSEKPKSQKKLSYPRMV